MSKHTKGQWDYAGCCNGKDLTIYALQHDMVKNALAVNGGEGYIATIKTRESGFDIVGTEAEANARLIAAAPEMLETIKKCLAYMIDDKSSDVTGKEALDSINAILTKIEA